MKRSKKKTWAKIHDETNMYFWICYWIACATAGCLIGYAVVTILQENYSQRKDKLWEEIEETQRQIEDLNTAIRVHTDTKEMM